jgi:hypothetical protein
MHLSRAAERLIAHHVDSVGALDLLLLLHGDRERNWHADELRAALRCPKSWIDVQLARLVALELVDETSAERFRYRHGPRFGLTVDEVARACRRDRAAVTRRIFARPPFAHGRAPARPA